MFSKKLLVILVVISVLIGVMNCKQTTQEKIYGEGICQYPENCTQPQLPPPSTDQPQPQLPPPSTDQPQPQLPPPSTDQPYDVPPPPKPKSHPPKPSIPEKPVPSGYSPYTTTPPPPPPSAASAYPDIFPPPPAPPSNPPPNPYTYLNETINSADAPPSALPLFPTAAFYILFLFAYYA